jgi:hypothetical protein
VGQTSAPQEGKKTEATMRRIVVFGTAALLAIATLEARQQQDPDGALHAGNVTILSVIGYEYEVTQADGPEPTTHLELRNVNLFSNSFSKTTPCC